MRVKYSLLFVVLLAFMVGCSKVELYSKLGEQEANEMMAILLAEHIPCSKMSMDEDSWSLKVQSSDFSRAVRILTEEGYPKQKFVGIGQVFQKSGLVSSPTEERIRFMYALSQELGETISEIDGVVSARVHIVLPNNNPFGDIVQPSSASVFVRHRPGVDRSLLIPDITRLVTGSIEGLEYDNVSCVMLEAKPAVTEIVTEEKEHGDSAPVKQSSMFPSFFLSHQFQSLALVGVSVFALALVIFTTISKTRGRKKESSSMKAPKNAAQRDAAKNNAVEPMTA